MVKKIGETFFSHHDVPCIIPCVLNKQNISVVWAKAIFENLSTELPSHLYNEEVIRESLTQTIKTWAERKQIAYEKICIDTRNKRSSKKEAI